MIIQIIGWYCLLHVLLGEIAIIASVVQKDELPEGSRARANFINVSFLAVAAWCFK